MARINLNTMARNIALKEAGKKEISIAQVKEVMKLIFQALAKMTIWEIGGILKRYKK